MHVFPGGYCGLSQVEDDETNLCFLAHTSTLQAARRQFAGPPLQSLLDWMQAHNPALRVWLSQAELAASGWRSIAQVSFERKQASYAGALMAGDSAGLIAPLAGDGIAMALQSGQVAASQVSAVLSGDRSVAHLPGAYQSAWDRQFRSRMRLASFLQAVLLQPTWASLVLQLLNRVPSLGDLLVEKTRGSLPV
jgi:flavin-dependent dehydrogenase